MIDMSETPNLFADGKAGSPARNFSTGLMRRKI